MKKLLTIIFLASMAIAGKTEDTNAQVIVNVRPTAPKVVVRKPAPRRRGMVWVGAHWKWNRRGNRYQWVEGYWTKPRRGKVWITGTWRKVNGGWRYQPGYWS